MSLLRLLTAGKSLVGLKNSDTRYHLPGQCGLPKFGSKKNPFRATVVPEKVEQPEAVAEVKESPCAGDSKSAQSSIAGPQEVASAAACAEKPAGAGRQTSKESCQTVVHGQRHGFAVKALLVWARARKVHPGVAPVGRRMVQGELSLDKIKVVRNDLSESDVEVRQSVSSPTTEKVSSSNPLAHKEPALHPAAWGLAAGRLFGMGKL